MEFVSLKDVTKETKILLLKELGYNSDGVFVLDSNGAKHIDPHIEQPVKLQKLR